MCLNKLSLIELLIVFKLLKYTGKCPSSIKMRAKGTKWIKMEIELGMH